MKRLIRWALNHLPRPVLQRMAGWAVPLVGLFYRGRGAECPVCGARFRRFLPYGYVHARSNALCAKCLSLERHRLLWLYLTRETDLLRTFPQTLHIAPEVCIMRHLKPHFAAHPDRYATADLESPLADLHFDVQQIPLADASVDVVICNHLRPAPPGGTLGPTPAVPCANCTAFCVPGGGGEFCCRPWT